MSVRQHARGALRGQRPPCGLPCGSPSSERAMRWTTSAISRLRIRTRASLALPASGACAPRSGGYRLFSRQCDSLRPPAPTRLSARPPRRALSSRRAACTPASGTPVASPAAPAMLAHDVLRESRQDRPETARVNERPRERPRMPSIPRKASAPRCPFGHPARPYPGAVASPPRHRFSTPLLFRGSLASSTELGPPVTRPLPRGRASLSLDVVR